MLVILDPAHGKETPGKCSPDKRLLEWKWSREFLEVVEKKLDEAAIPHVRDWSGDNEPGLTQRCNMANAIAKKNGCGPCVFISAHCNAAGSDGKWHDANGWSVFVGNNASSNSKKLATLMTGNAKASGIKVRVPSQSQPYWVQNLTVCQKTNMPAVLVENMFQDNKADVDFLLSDKGKDVLAEIIVKSVKEYFTLCTHQGCEN